MTRKPWWTALLLILSGCVSTSGFNRPMLEARLHDDAVKVTDEDIKTIKTLAAQLHFPCRIAVALKADSENCRWTPKERQAMEVWAAVLRQEGVASDVVFMSKMFLVGETLKELRASAAKYGADALLLVKGSAATDCRMNPIAVFNLTIVGGFLMPGSCSDALFLLEGVLIDVNNGYLYASVESEGEGSKLAPTFLIDEKDAVDRAKQEALKSFGAELLLRMRNLRASCQLAGTPLASKP